MRTTLRYLTMFCNVATFSVIVAVHFPGGHCPVAPESQPHCSENSAWESFDVLYVAIGDSNPIPNFWYLRQGDCDYCGMEAHIAGSGLHGILKTDCDCGTISSTFDIVSKSNGFRLNFTNIQFISPNSESNGTLDVFVVGQHQLWTWCTEVGDRILWLCNEYDTYHDEKAFLMTRKLDDQNWRNWSKLIGLLSFSGLRSRDFIRVNRTRWNANETDEASDSPDLPHKEQSSNVSLRAIFVFIFGLSLTIFVVLAILETCKTWSRSNIVHPAM